MTGSLSIFVGLRYTRSKRRNRFISLISLISLIGLVLGVAALILVLSVMNGFDREIKERILHVVPHMYMAYPDAETAKGWEEDRKAVLTLPRVQGAAPYIQGDGMIVGDDVVRGIAISGVLPEVETGISVLNQHMVVGDINSLEAGEFGIVLGGILARHLGVTLGDKVTIVLPEFSVTPFGVFPRQKRFTVTGVFQVGAALDGELVMMHMDDARRFLRHTAVADGLRLRLDDLYAVDDVAPQLQQHFPALDLKSWSETQGTLFQAVKMEKTVIAILLLAIVAVASFNIVSILTMMVTDKRSEIAVMRTLGASPWTVMQIFIVQGCYIGVLGTFLGTAIGVGLALSISPLVSFVEELLGLYVFDPNVYYITYLPSELRMDDVVMVVSCALIISLLATLYPAWRASRISPVEALQYD